MKRRAFLGSAAVGSVALTSGCVTGDDILSGGCGPGEVRVDEMQEGTIPDDRTEITAETKETIAVEGYRQKSILLANDQTGDILIFLREPQQDITMQTCYTFEGVPVAEAPDDYEGVALTDATIVGKS